MTRATDKITLVLADDEAVARAGIRALLSQAEDIEVIGEAEDGFEAQQMVAELCPRILLLDLKMPGPRPVELAKWAREHSPETAILVLTAHHREVHLANMMEAGAAGYLKKENSAEALINAVRNAARGVVHFSEGQVEEIAHWKEEVGQKWESLSEREREILKLLALGARNQFIASELAITINTVESHVKSILKKLEVDSRQKAALWPVRNFPEETGGDW
ncbi:MAG: DNA-binding response regulator [Anaerolineaceae bacterium]|nr:DNA-binding response regulator [Anaerolineae bacterium]MBL1173225.1 DNA-binding response regulator [Chloroflexota bacterium]MDL1925608.1 response regulator transcription factor [Anaerolineae bacterium AMX1]WKZ52221.1 MAG: response regulator transcription factor [Anaerolineales bacterium]GJQ39473.1 MAG: DNA-binding response regulator [Anaerolineaceae bacterium]